MCATLEELLDSRLATQTRAIKAEWQAAGPWGGASWALRHQTLPVALGWNRAFTAVAGCCEEVSQAVGLRLGRPAASD